MAPQEIEADFAKRFDLPEREQRATRVSVIKSLARENTFHVYINDLKVGVAALTSNGITWIDVWKHDIDEATVAEIYARARRLAVTMESDGLLREPSWVVEAVIDAGRTALDVAKLLTFVAVAIAGPVYLMLTLTIKAAQ